MANKKSLYARVTLVEKIWAVLAILKAPGSLLYQITFARWNKVNSGKSIARIVRDFVPTYLTGAFNATQIQWLDKPNGDKFIAWGKSTKTNIVVEDIGEDATLLWMEEKRIDRVVLYLHGGGYLIPYVDGTPELLRHISLKAGGGQLGFGIVMLDFSTVTDRPFPAQLLQANRAITHLFKSGVRPENLQLIGDSAGGNLILQLFSHALHDFPDPAFPPSPLRPIIDGTMPSIRGAYLMSPWVNPSGHGGSFELNAAKDVLPLATYQEWGRLVLHTVPQEHRNFIEFNAAPADWFSGVEKLVKHVLITVGGDEGLHQDCVELNETFQKYHGDVAFIDQKYGIHLEPVFGFTGLDKKGEVTQALVNWHKTTFGL
ncbi:alpha/beta-hydrolase [Athelia psychrophila]|uniref:Alpha/beta-hydrolase n=1 Tax=Athelia psychrophila TaxID=1759441 RepID=A0A166VYL7_9AGAM|nr:alpha/beta-hydrolase [Fibularhizoctonia sp. CBS 109695]